MKILELFEGRNTEDADEFIHAWSYNADWHRNNHDAEDTTRGFTSAIAAYPYKKTSRLYRGLSFETETERAKVYEHLKTGKITDKSLSSWSRDKHQAMIFAMLDDEYDDRVPGFVISMVPPRGTRMVNASKSPKGENEIIVDAGTYDIRIEEVWFQR